MPRSSLLERYQQSKASLSLTSFAAKMGVSVQSVHEAIRNGRLPSAIPWGRGFIITDGEKGRQEWEENTEMHAGKGLKPAAGEPEASQKTNGNGHARDRNPSPRTLAQATLRERTARARLIELDYKRRRATLIPAQAAELMWSRIVTDARTTLLGLPTRAKQRLPHLSAIDLAEIDGLIREALEELGNGQNAGD